MPGSTLRTSLRSFEQLGPLLDAPRLEELALARGRSISQLLFAAVLRGPFSARTVTLSSTSDVY
ncbi:MAG TPA: hypothetical protein VGN48_03375 [Pedococcus sp.]|nr:hypothetical protein [Pedococcus sp.]